MAAIETVVGITKISDSHYEVDGDVLLGSGIDNVLNAAFNIVTGGRLRWGTGCNTTFTNCIFVEQQGSLVAGSGSNGGLTNRFAGTTTARFEGCTWIQAQTGRNDFDTQSTAAPTFTSGPDGSPCRFLLNPGSSQFNHFYGSNMIIESLYIDNMDGGGDMEFGSAGDFSGLAVKDNAPGSTARQIVVLTSGTVTFRGLSARNIALWQTSTVVRLIDPKGTIPKPGFPDRGSLQIYRTYRAVPFDPTTELAVSAKCYLVNNDNSSVVIDGFVTEIDEELFRQLSPNGDFTFSVVENNYTRGFYKYGYLPTSKTFDVLESSTGEIINDGDVLMLENTGITESSKAAVDAYTSIDNAYQFFDAYCSWLEDNYQAQGALAIVRLLGQIDLGAINLDIDATAVQVFDFDGSKITIKSSAYAGLLTTTGTVSLLNGATQSGGIIDSNGDSFLTFESIDSWVVYSSSANRDSNTSPLDSGTGSEVYRFTYSGGTTYYLRLTTGTDIIFKDVTPVASGETVVSLGTSALLGNINASIQESSQLAEYGGRVTVDLISGTNSTDYPYGTSKTPTFTIANALTIANDIGVKVIEVRGSFTALPQELNGYEVVAGLTDSAGAKLLPTITLSTSEGADNCEFEGFEIVGETDVTSSVFGNLYQSCLINGLTGATGVARDCKLAGTIQVEYSIDVQGSYGTVAFNVSGTNARLTVPDFSGSMTIAGMASATAVAIIGVVSGIVTIDSSCTAGTIVVANADQVVDNSAGASVTILQDSGGGGGGLTAQQVWEYDISSISTDGLAGKELLDASGAGSGADVNIVSVNGVAVTNIDDFKADVSGLPTALEIDTQLSSTHGVGSWSGDDAATIYAYFADGVRADAFKATGFSTFDPLTTSVTVSAIENNVITASTIANNAFTNSAFTTGYYNTINSELDSALADYDAPTKAELDAGLAALQVHGDTTWQTATGFSTFNPATDTVARVALVDVCTENTDQRGTDGANTVAPDNATINSISATVELLRKYHDNESVFLASDQSTKTTQSLAYYTVVYDDDGVTPLKTVMFTNSAGSATALPNATGYEKL